MTEVRARKALGNLYEPNRNNENKVAHSLKSNQVLNPKQAFLEANDKLTKLKKRNSISLPDINLLVTSLNGSDSLNKSATSTPNKSLKKMSSSKSNISIIYENDKENPNLMKVNLQKLKNMESKKLSLRKTTILKQSAKIETKEISIQCNKGEEDMVFGDSVKGTDYWRLIAHKRMNALAETKRENLALHETIETVNEKNEKLRENIKELYELISQYKELQKAALEAEEENDDVDDSGLNL